MKLHKVCLDFDMKVFPKEIVMQAFEILNIAVRQNLETDIDDLMFTQDEGYLAEAQERMYKAESHHTWTHFSQQINDLSDYAKENRDQI